MAIAAAAEQKVDATPMEGFDSDQLDDLLKLSEIGYKSTVILPLGYRDGDNDWLINMKKYRSSKEQFVLKMSVKDAADINVSETFNLNDLATK